MKEATQGKIRQWSVWHVAKPEWARTVSAFTRGKALMDYWRTLRDGWDDVQYIDLRAQVIPGGPETSNEFIRVAESRGLPNLRCGDRVCVSGAFGTIVGHNASANFEVLFDQDGSKYAGQQMNVHPNSMEIL